MYSEKMNWPEGVKCAVAITINLNAELFWLQIDPSCIDKPKTLSLGQYGMNRGLDRILDILEERNIKGTFFTPGWIAENYSDEVKRVYDRGHEIGCLAYKHENMALLSEEEQRKAIEKGLKAIGNVCDYKVKGFRSPEGELTEKTLMLAKECGLEYSSNLSCDDRPYINRLSNGETLGEIPIHWANYDLPYFAFNYNPAFPKGQGRIANYNGVLSNWKDEFDGCYEYGLCYVLQLDPATIGAPGRISLLEDLLDYIMEKNGVWFATGEELNDYIGKIER